MRILIAGGGTGGHATPAVAIVEELRKRDPRLRVLWAGKKGKIEERICSNHAIPFRPIPARGWPRGGRIALRLWTLVVLALGVFRAGLMLLSFRPQLVLGVGGYVSLPVLWAAQRLGYPTVLHEQNKRLGLANRLLAPRAAWVFLSYPETIGHFPGERSAVTGNPVRAAFLDPPDHLEACRRFDLDPAIPVLLVCGGSQGAARINAAMADALPSFAPGSMQVVWMTGELGVDEARAAATKAKIPVQVFSFIDDMPAACAAASLIVSRAGASSTAEIAALGKPSILVPYPQATDDHQKKNAEAFETAGAAVLLEDALCDGDSLGNEIRGILGDASRREGMAIGARQLARLLAAEEIVETMMTLVVDTPSRA